MKRLFAIIASITFALNLLAQAIGTWQVYPAYNICTYNIPVKNKVYALMENNLIVYDTEDQSVTGFDWMTQLSDVTISLIRYSAEARRIIIVYENGNIDLLSIDDDSNVTNIPYLKNSTLQNKSVNAVQVVGKTAYVCTGFGIMEIDMQQAIVTDTYMLDMSITGCAVLGDYIYAGTTTGIWRGLMTDNLLDKANWEQINTSLNVLQLETFDGHLFARISNALWMMNEANTNFTKILTISSTYLSVTTGTMIIGSTKQTVIFSTYKDYETCNGTYSWSQLTASGKLFWASDGYNGLQAYSLNDGEFALQTRNIHLNSPLHDFCYHLRFAGRRLLVAGGNGNYAVTNREGTAMYLEPDGTWVNFDPQEATAAYSTQRYRDVTNIAQDPLDATHHFAGTARNGIYEFKDGKIAGHIGMENSPLQTILPTSSRPQQYISADGLIYDSYGNLWMLNCTEGRNDTIIRILKADGKWTSIPRAVFKEAVTMDRIFFDSRGYAWLNSRRMEGRGIGLLKFNPSTLKATAAQLHSVIINQDGTSYAPDEFYCISEDKEGNIWCGTGLGPFVITDPDAFLNSNFTFEQIKVSRNDGSGLADYLLTGIPVFAVATDGAGRKWIGTQDNGAYLISADNQEQILHFTTDNSPLPSNDIYDIVIDGESGKVFFATTKGLASYVSDATEPAYELDKDNVIAFPNPVEPDYHGPITVRGLVANSEVKIISVTGQLISSGVSIGGTYTWNGCNQEGRRVASGIYNVVANTPDGKKAIVTRIAFIH